MVYIPYNASSIPRLDPCYGGETGGYAPLVRGADTLPPASRRSFFSFSTIFLYNALRLAAVAGLSVGQMSARNCLQRIVSTCQVVCWPQMSWVYLPKPVDKCRVELVNPRLLVQKVPNHKQLFLKPCCPIFRRFNGLLGCGEDALNVGPHGLQDEPKHGVFILAPLFR